MIGTLPAATSFATSPTFGVWFSKYTVIPASLKPIIGRMPMPAATMASTPASASRPTGRRQPPSSCGGFASSDVPLISPSSMSTMVKQSQWPKWPERSDARSAAPIVGTASFSVYSHDDPSFPERRRSAYRLPRPCRPGSCPIRFQSVRAGAALPVGRAGGGVAGSRLRASAPRRRPRRVYRFTGSAKAFAPVARSFARRRPAFFSRRSAPGRPRGFGRRRSGRLPAAPPAARRAAGAPAARRATARPAPDPAP